MLGVHCSCTCLCPVQHLAFNVLSGEQKFIFLFYDFFLFKVTIECANMTINMLVIRQKGKSQNRWFKKTKLAKLPEKQTFITLWYAHICVIQRDKKCLFFGKFGILCFLETCILRFALLPYYRQKYVLQYLTRYMLIENWLLTVPYENEADVNTPKNFMNLKRRIIRRKIHAKRFLCI